MSKTTKGNGKGIQFLRALLVDAPPDCVTWPLFRDPDNGYGRVGYNGKQWWAHILICEMVHGSRPSEAHEATHSCGNGKLGCVNPRHLDWGTRSRNQKDRRFHGTKARGGYRGARRKLHPADVEQIRALKGQKTQREIAAQFGVTDATIRDIFSGKSWGPERRPDHIFTVAEVMEIEKLYDYISVAEIGLMFRCSHQTIYRVMRRAPEYYKAQAEKMAG